MKKVVIIGAGSVIFTKTLVADFIADGGEWELAMVDINEESLKAAGKLTKRMVEHKNSPITVSMSTERKDLLPHADIVVTTLAVGGRAAAEQDIFIQRKYGNYWPVSDTTTPGGFARSLRILPVMVDIVRDTDALSPNARIFNYCNPMAAIVRAVTKETGKEICGLCHGVAGAIKYLANYLGVERDRCSCTAVGFNHFVWLLEFLVDGKDGYPLVREKNRGQVAEGKLPGNDEHNRLSWELFDLHGYFPGSRDRHIVEFFPHLFPEGRHYGKVLGVDRFSFEDTAKKREENFERTKTLAMGDGPLPNGFFHDKVGNRELLVPILQALEQKDARSFHATVPNTGQLANIERGLCVESPVNFSQAGAQPIPIGTIPAGIKAHIDKAFVTTELIIEAAMERDRAKFVQAIVIDGCIGSVRQAHELADELLAAHKDLLPGW